jgi:dienelactone hydrolase
MVKPCSRSCATLSDMRQERRDFMKCSALSVLGLAGERALEAVPFARNQPMPTVASDRSRDSGLSVIGVYGPWAASLNRGRLPSFSFRNKRFAGMEAWRTSARKRVMERMAIPDIGSAPKINVNKEYVYDGLHIEEISWQLPYGRPTEALVLKPLNGTGKLPGILAFHDHGGNKYFGKSKITRTSDQQHPLIKAHQNDYYEGAAWANEIAKRGYVVLVPDAFLFASRRVMLGDVPEHLRNGLDDNDPEDPANIKRYNEWAGQHEHVMAKSLFGSGTTWPGVFFAEDQKALDVLCSRDDVDVSRIGCGGLSGGGLRTVFMGGLDPRIKAAVCVGFMTTWKDFLLNKSFTHTWMAYVPLLPNELDFPEILGLRVPRPTFVLNDNDDDLYTPAEMREAERILCDVYRKGGGEHHLKLSYYPGPHKFDKKMQADAFAWLDRWLKSGF